MAIAELQEYYNLAETQNLLNYCELATLILLLLYYYHYMLFNSNYL